ncbi:hypothetical protein [Paenibacillus montanisoli]|nr:hypothetical protein [Paenibacillus montanisoli]
MKILMIGFTKLAYMPYMNFYLEQLTQSDNEIHLLYWNRDEKDEITLPYKNIILHEFKLYQEDEVSKVRKVKSFIKFRKNAKRLLLNNNFDLVIVMHTVPGVLLNDILFRYYSKRFILDYRDITFEKIGLYKKIVNRLVENSIATFVSSNAFREYLPVVDNIFTSHNILIDSLDNRDIRRCKSRKSEPIRIRFWGFIRHELINRAIIDGIANDNRFELHYHGREQDTANNLKKHCERNKIKNVYFHGQYNPDERYEFAKETDLIHNIYENDKMTQPAMANKFYDGITFYIPQLCSTGSFMGTQITKNSIGLSCDPSNKSFADDLFSYYNSIAWSEFEINCDKKLREILMEYQSGTNIIRDIVK